MPRARDAKVWNEELVQALQARHEQCRQQGSQRQYLWRDGCNLIQQVRSDIYAFKSSGRVVGLPRKLTKTVEEEVRAIIAGTRPILPEGYMLTTAELSIVGVNPYEQDPYLKRIKFRGGSYAILMVFHNSFHKTLTKEQICTAAQPYCDDEMEANYFQGRAYGAWSSKKILAKHGFVQENRATTRVDGSYQNVAACNTYTLTESGKLFTQALLQKFPQEVQTASEDRVQQKMGLHVTPSPTNTDSLSASPKKSPRRTLYEITNKPSSRKQRTIATDRKELYLWLQSSESDLIRQKKFKAGQTRRDAMVRLCNELNTLNPKLELITKVDGHDTAAALYVFINQKPKEFKFPNSEVSAAAMSNNDEPPVEGFQKRPRITKSPVQIKSKDVKAKPTNVAAKRSLFGQTKSYFDIPPSSSDDDSDMEYTGVQSPTNNEKIQDTRPSATGISTQKTPLTVVILSSSSESDHDGDKIQPPPIARKKCPTLLISKAPELIILDSSDDDDESRTVVTQHSQPPKIKTSQHPQLTILIDSRERDRNATPRKMRFELLRHLEKASLKAIWPSGMNTGMVREEQLSIGDFVFEVAGRRLSIAIERKRVSDLVGRSVRGDHWRQLQGMRDCCQHAILLIEGDMRTAGASIAYDMDEAMITPDQFSIDSESTMIRFLARAILSSKRINIAQSKDEQSTYRLIGAIGLCAALSNSSSYDLRSAKSPKVEVNQLYGKLSSRGVPWQLARRVAEEVGSIHHLDILYSNCGEEQRGGLLVPYISATCSATHKDGSKLIESGSAEEWSLAIYSAFDSMLNNPKSGGDLYKEHSSSVQNKAQLLRKIHSGLSKAAFLKQNKVNSESNKKRCVIIRVPSSMKNMLPSLKGSESFYELEVDERANNTSRLQSIVMQAQTNQAKSDKLNLHILEGSTLLEMVTSMIESCKGNPVKVYQGTARMIHEEINRYEPLLETDRHVVVIRGLRPALDAAARKRGYRPTTSVIVDLVMSELMLSYGYVILHAVRLSRDLELIAQEFALACWHYQLLTRPNINDGKF